MTEFLTLLMLIIICFICFSLENMGLLIIYDISSTSRQATIEMQPDGCEHLKEPNMAYVYFNVP